MFVGGCGVGPEIGNPATQGEVQFCRSLLLCVFIQIGRVYLPNRRAGDAPASAAARREWRETEGEDVTRARAAVRGLGSALVGRRKRGENHARTHAAARGTAHARCVWYRNTCPGHAQDQRLTIGDRVTIKLINDPTGVGR